MYTGLFTIELILRVAVGGCGVFYNLKIMAWFYLDLFVVVTSLLEIFIELFSKLDDDDTAQSDFANMSSILTNVRSRVCF